MPLTLIPELHRATHGGGVYIADAPQFDLTQAEAHLLSQLASSGEQTIAALHATFGHKRSTLTSILDRLVARGLVTREVPEHDRRSITVRPTRSGKVVAGKAYARLADLEARVTRRVSAAALAGYHAVIQAIELEAAAEAPIARKRSARA